MIKRVGAMPPGTVGFQTVGDVYTDDWEEVVEPVLHEQITAGAKIRMLLIVGPKNRWTSTGSRSGATWDSAPVMADHSSDWQWSVTRIGCGRHSVCSPS